MSSDPIQLNYGRPKALLARGRLWTLVVIAALLLTAYLWGPDAWRSLNVTYWMHKCNQYVAPTGQVVYDEDSARAAPLFQAGGGRPRAPRGGPATGYVANPPTCWDRFRHWQGYASDLPLVFLHDRLSPHGGRWLVAVTFDPWRGLEALSFRSDLFHHDAITIDVDRPGPLRLFAGQPDPIDSSHFTITYEFHGAQRTIDGWLGDDGFVTMKVRDGPAKLP